MSKHIIRIKDLNDEIPFWLEQAIDFYESSKILDDSASEYRNIPIITMLSFSIECSLKAISIHFTATYKNIHELHKLFKTLPQAAKSDIQEEFKDLYDADFNNCLLDINGDFVRSRYYIEELKKSYFGRGFSIGYLKIIADFLINYAKNRHIPSNTSFPIN